MVKIKHLFNFIKINEHINMTEWGSRASLEVQKPLTPTLPLVTTLCQLRKTRLLVYVIYLCWYNNKIRIEIYTIQSEYKSFLLFCQKLILMIFQFSCCVWCESEEFIKGIVYYCTKNKLHSYDYRWKFFVFSKTIIDCQTSRKGITRGTSYSILLILMYSLFCWGKESEH